MHAKQQQRGEKTNRRCSLGWEWQHSKVCHLRFGAGAPYDSATLYIDIISMVRPALNSRATRVRLRLRE